MADKQQDARQGNIRLTLADRPDALTVNWQAGRLLMFLRNGTMLEVYAGPGELRIEWLEGGDQATDKAGSDLDTETKEVRT